MLEREDLENKKPLVCDMMREVINQLVFGLGEVSFV